MKTTVTFLLIAAVSISAFAQKWEKIQPNILFAQDKNQSFSTVKVGIRTDNPAAAMDVNGPTRTRGNALFDSLAQALSMKAKSAEFETALVTRQLTAGSLMVNGTTLMNGNVGVGLNNPSANLHIYSGTSIVNLKLQNPHGTAEIGSNGNGPYIFSISPNRSISFFTTDFNSNTGRRMSIDGNGNVSISDGFYGTEKFSVDGNIQASGSIRANGMSVAGQTQFDSIKVQGRIRANFYASNSPLIFEAPALTERARIDDVTGNFGIGTSSPFAKLHVVNFVSTGAIITTNHAFDYGYGILSEVNRDLTKAIVVRNNSTNNETFLVYGDGRVGIGTDPDGDPTFKLSVNGNTFLNGNVFIGPGKLAATGDFEAVKNVFLATQFPSVTTIADNVNSSTTYDTPDRLRLDVRGDGRFTSTASSTNYVRVGYNNVNAIMDNFGLGDLLINNYSGKNVTIGPGKLTATGNFEAVTNTYLATGSGNVGIGTTSPNVLYKLDVNGSVNATNYLINGQPFAGEWQQIGNDIYNTNTSGSVIINTRISGGLFIREGLPDELRFLPDNGGAEIGSKTGTITFWHGGAPSNLQYNNLVCGRLQTKVLEVAPDYVFAKEYHLMPLEELEKYKDKYKHLPDVPSGKEIDKNGISVGDFSLVLLKKVEELTLYMIELKKQNNAMEEEIEKLKKRK